jgi:UDP-N-acetylmuramoylalanine--D-glutamate ligase
VSKLVVLGGGESGVGAAILAKSQGFDVFLSDFSPISEKYRSELVNRNILFEEAGHSENFILDADLVVKSPGIPNKAAIVKEIRAKGIQIVSEIEFASRYTNARIVAITGSNGKTTTTLLSYHLLKEAGLNVGLAGNIGDSFAWQVAEKNFDYYVLEISSFQLDDIVTFSPEISVLLNITPDHLDRYEYKFENYIQSKFNIIQNFKKQSHFIYFDDSEVVKNELTLRSLDGQKWPVSLTQPVEAGGYFTDDKLISNCQGQHLEVDYSKLPIKGAHNAVNALSAVLVAQLVGVEGAQIQASLLTFKNAPHRLEKVRTIGGVDYVNDSKATNVDSVFYALSSFKQPIIWIAGGVDKGNDYSYIEELVRQKVKSLIILTPHFEKLQQYFNNIVADIYVTEDMQDALNVAKSKSVEGDIVLLSPACASFDLFQNYEDRGDKFKDAVLKL